MIIKLNTLYTFRVVVSMYHVVNDFQFISALLLSEEKIK